MRKFSDAIDASATGGDDRVPLANVLRGERMLSGRPCCDPTIVAKALAESAA